MGDSLTMAADKAKSTQPPYVFTFHLMKFARINNIHPRPNGRTSYAALLSRVVKIRRGCESTEKKESDEDER
jgi:hypothetical protein